MGEARRRSAQVWHALSRDITVSLPITHAFIHEWIEPCPSFASPAKAGPHLLITVGREAELAQAPQP